MGIEILPIGSVCQVGDAKLMIVGHSLAVDDDNPTAYYYCIDCPLGFVSFEKIHAVPIVELNNKLIKKGYCDEMMNNFLKNQEYLINSCYKYGFKNVEKILNDFNNNLEEKIND